MKLGLYTSQPYNIDSLKIAGNSSNIDLLFVNNYYLFVKISLYKILI